MKNNFGFMEFQAAAPMKTARGLTTLTTVIVLLLNSYNSAFPDLSQLLHSTSVMQDMVAPVVMLLLSMVFKFNNTNPSGIKT